MNSGFDLESAIAEAVGHHRAGRIPEAEGMYGEILKAAPRHPRVSHNLGAIYLQRKQFDQALPLMKVAAEGDSDGQQMWIGYGHALLGAEHFEAAEALVSARASRTPEATALALRLRQAWGVHLMAAGDLDRAEAQFQAALELAPENAQTHAYLGSIRLSQGKVNAAVVNLRRAVELDPNNIRALINLSGGLSGQGHVEEAIMVCRRALALEPDNAAALQNLGVALAASGQQLEGLLALDRAVELEPEVPLRSFSRALVRLAAGDFAGGWRDYEARWRTQSFAYRSTTSMTARLQERLNLDSNARTLASARVLLVAEQGIGDQLMFASMIPDLARVASHVTLICEPQLVRLFAHSFPGLTVLSHLDAEMDLSSFDVVLAPGSLGRIFRNRLEDFPGAPYLKPDREALARWAARLGSRPSGPRIGVSWRGGTEATRISERSVTLEQLIPVFDLPGCEVISLQYGDPRPEIAAFNEGRGSKIRVFPPEDLKDVEDLAGLIEELDVVVSVQTAVVHLAGALGKDCLAMLPANPEWRYAAPGSAMPWYGSVRLLRQTSSGDWESVVTGVVEALKAWSPSLGAD